MSLGLGSVHRRTRPALNSNKKHLCHLVGTVMPKTLKWLHLSDIHFNKKTKWRDDAVIVSLFNYLNDIFEKDASLYPDLIFCTGDIAFGETTKLTLSEQYDDAKEFFEELLKVCGHEGKPLAKERLFVVPGNHDINQKTIPVLSQAALNQWATEPKKHVGDINNWFNNRPVDFYLVMKRQDEYAQFIEEYLRHQNDIYGRNCYAETVNIDGLVVGIGGFNSAWTSSGSTDEDKLWMAAKWQLNKAQDKFKKEKAAIKIGLIHHPIDWLNSEDQTEVSKRIPKEFHFWLYGHGHDLWVDPGQKIVKIVAGAVGAENSEEFGINLVKLDLLNTTVDVYTHTYKYGWKKMTEPDDAPDGIWNFGLPFTEKEKNNLKKLAEKKSDPLVIRDITNELAQELEPYFKKIADSLTSKNRKLVFFLGPGINYVPDKSEAKSSLPPDLIDIAKILAVKDHTPADLIGLPCEACPEKLNDRPIEKGDSNKTCPIRNKINNHPNRDQLRYEQDLLFAKLELRCWSQYLIKQYNGEDTHLFDRLRKILGTEYKFNLIHELLAKLAKKIADSRIKSNDPFPMFIITTNYDNGLEKAFAYVGMPIDVIYYSTILSSEDKTPTFKHIRYEDPVEDRDKKKLKKYNNHTYVQLKSTRDFIPKNYGKPQIPQIPQIPIILKLFGGVEYIKPDFTDENGSFVIAETHKIDFYKKAKKVLEGILTSYLSKSDFVFLGFTPNDADLHAILHYFFEKLDPIESNFMWRDDIGKLSENIPQKELKEILKNMPEGWLVTQSQLPHLIGNMNDVDYWNHWRVGLIPCTWNEFLELFYKYWKEKPSKEES